MQIQPLRFGLVRSILYHPFKADPEAQQEAIRRAPEFDAVAFQTGDAVSQVYYAFGEDAVTLAQNPDNQRLKEALASTPKGIVDMETGRILC